tara:strand:+ start:180 stop:428 length:249 start_codon:yes stop_codon:yes gene_type:complete
MLQFLVVGIVYFKYDISITHNGEINQFLKRITVEYHPRTIDQKVNLEINNAEKIKCLTQKEVVEIPCRLRHEGVSPQEIWRW